MQNQKVGVELLRADGHVVPNQVVILQEGFQPLGQPPLARCHPGAAGGEGGDERGHQFLCK